MDHTKGIYTGEWVEQQEFPPLQWVVPGVIPEGLTVLTGDSDRLNANLAVGIALDVAGGDAAFGGIAGGAPREVLYVALDRERTGRIGRASLSGHGRPVPDMLTFVSCVALGSVAELVDLVEQKVEEKPGTALIVIAPFGGALPAPDDEKRAACALHDITKAHGGLGIIVTAADMERADLDYVSDTILNQTRRVILEVTGRDIPGMVYRMDGDGRILSGGAGA